MVIDSREQPRHRLHLVGRQIITIIIIIIIVFPPPPDCFCNSSVAIVIPIRRTQAVWATSAFLRHVYGLCPAVYAPVSFYRIFLRELVSSVLSSRCDRAVTKCCAFCPNTCTAVVLLAKSSVNDNAGGRRWLC